MIATGRGWEVRRGDALRVMEQMPSGSVQAIITDPPYGIAYQSAWRTDKRDRFDVIQGDTELDFSWLAEACRVMANTSSLFIFCRWDVQGQFYDAIAEHFQVRSQVIWDRGVHGLGDLNAQYAPCHDVAWFATKGKWKFPNGRPKSVYRVDRLPANELLHPTQKPVPLMRVIVSDLTQFGDTVLDCFAGSGPCGVACIKTGRRFLGVEIDPGYFDIAVKRLREAEMQLSLFPAEAL